VSPWFRKLNEIAARAGVRVSKQTAVVVALLLLAACAWGVARFAGGSSADASFEVVQSAEAPAADSQGGEPDDAGG